MNQHLTINALKATASTSERTMVLPFQRRSEDARGEADLWLDVLAAARGEDVRLPTHWSALFGPLIARENNQQLVIAQLGQSLDGRIATRTGHSKYINGAAGLVHLHRLRALCDAVVIGVGTALADDPLLTVRLCCGDQPARVVIDPAGRLPAASRLLSDDGGRTIIVTAASATARLRTELPAHAEIIHLPCEAGLIEPAAIVSALRAHGLNRLLIEGGAQTLSRFVQASMLDRLHILVAPIILGSGQPGLDLPPIDRLDEAMRPAVAPHLIGDEIVFDCDFRTGRR